MGILTAQGAANWHPALDEIRGAAKKVIEFCKI